MNGEVTGIKVVDLTINGVMSPFEGIPATSFKFFGRGFFDVNYQVHDTMIVH